MNENVCRVVILVQHHNSNRTAVRNSSRTHWSLYTFWHCSLSCVYTHVQITYLCPKKGTSIGKFWSLIKFISINTQRYTLFIFISSKNHINALLFVTCLILWLNYGAASRLTIPIGPNSNQSARRPQRSDTWQAHSMILFRACVREAVNPPCKLSFQCSERNQRRYAAVYHSFLAFYVGLPPCPLQAPILRIYKTENR